MEMMWVCGVIVLLVSEARSLDSDVRNQTVSLGSAANLTCTNRTWNEMIYNIWKITLKTKKCQISFSDGKSYNNCSDGKFLRNTSSAQSYLHIQKVSIADEGVYNCESIYRRGGDDVTIYLDVTVAPTISTWLEQQDNRTVAVCRAEQGKPAASIMWKSAGNLPLVTKVETQRDPDGFFRVESRLVLAEGDVPENLSCSVKHAFWEEEKIMIVNQIKDLSWFPLRISVLIIIGVLVVPVLLFFVGKNLLRRRLRFNMSEHVSKSLPAEDVEEVEPYASYVQRVNSIYNSSAVLFT
ncbi:cell surface glycoprotein CD200 receptor 1-B isoform X2 [Thalassophryne amazonica]|uniref:cell surface glycoprotein CD200 receptor 1-B isoform X2 n=1 Tax=Thalassophryne amazonica TaxID=390379 RepID=UPI001471047B|nr:cell surface glycoprotein CD200 receptor 1-B isoform X2 [Thalassophryne amazonica]